MKAQKVTLGVGGVQPEAEKPERRQLGWLALRYRVRYVDAGGADRVVPIGSVIPVHSISDAEAQRLIAEASIEPAWEDAK